MIEVGVIGLGKMGMLHLMSCMKIDGVDVVGVANLFKESLDKANEIGIDQRFALGSNPKKLGLIAAGVDPFSIDWTILKIAENA